MRSVVALLGGTAGAVIVYWVGAVVALIIMHGIPLGSAGGPPTTGDIVVHLGLGLVAAFCGGLVATRIAAIRPGAHALACGVLLAVGAIVGFGKPTSHWPAWFGFGVAAVCLLGALAAALSRSEPRPA